MKVIPYCASFSLIAMITACGGSGGSSTDTPATSRLQYSGQTTGAELTAESAPQLLDEIFSPIGNFASVVGVETSQSISRIGILQKLNEINSYVTGAADVNSVVGVAIDDIQPCAEGGAVAVTGDHNLDTGAVNFNLAFDACGDDGLILNGDLALTGTINALEDFEGPVSMTFSELSVTDQGNTAILEGDSSCTFSSAVVIGELPVDIAPPTSVTCTHNLLMETVADAKVYRLENIDMSVLDSFLSQSTLIRGRYFNPDLGYVDIANAPNDPQNQSPFGLMFEARAIFIPPPEFDQSFLPENDVSPLNIESEFLETLPISTSELGLALNGISALITGSNGSAAEAVGSGQDGYDLYLDTDGDGNFDAPIFTTW